METAGFEFFFKGKNILKTVYCNRNINDGLCLYRRDGGTAHVLNIFNNIAQDGLQPENCILRFNFPFLFMFTQSHRSPL